VEDTPAGIDEETARTSAGRRASGRFGVLLLAELVLASLVGFMFLGRPSLWLDEGFSVRISQLDWPQLFEVIGENDAAHGLYYVVLKLWTGMVGTSEFALRTPSAVFAVGAVVALVLLGRTLFTDRIGLIAGMLLIVNPFMVLHARDARGYAMVTMLITVASLLFVRQAIALRGGSWQVVVYTIVGTLAVYAHVWSIFVLIVHAGMALIVKQFRPRLLLLIASWATMAILSAPLLYFLLLSDGTDVSWISNVGVSLFVHHFRSHAGGWVLMVIYLVGVLAAFGYCFIGDTNRGRARWPIGMLTAWIAVPPVLTFLVSLWVPVFVSRYLIVSLPALVLLVAVGVDTIKPAWMKYAILGVVVILSMVNNIPRYESSFENWRGATSYVLENAGEGDMILFYSPYVLAPYTYYEERATSGMPPEVMRYDLVGVDDVTVSLDLVLVSVDAEVAVDAVVSAVREGGDRQAWVVLSHDWAGAELAIEQQLREIRNQRSRTVFAGSIRVVQLAPSD